MEFKKGDIVRDVPMKEVLFIVDGREYPELNFLDFKMALMTVTCANHPDIKYDLELVTSIFREDS